MLDTKQITQLKSMGISFRENALLSEYTHTKTGGSTPLILFPKDEEELKRLIVLVHDQQIPFHVLGDMTNVAIASGQLGFVVICTNKILSEPLFDKERCVLTVSAGYKMKALSRWAMEHSLRGLQWMEGIPGTVGAGAYMNAGYLPGQDFQSCMIDARVLSPSGEIRVISNRNMRYSYRKSSIQSTGDVVLSVRFLLRTGKNGRFLLECYSTIIDGQKISLLIFPRQEQFLFLRCRTMSEGCCQSWD